jgi:hypothetical protein
VRDVRQDVTGVRGDLQKVARDADLRRVPIGQAGSTPPAASAPASPALQGPHVFDDDAT